MGTFVVIFLLCAIQVLARDIEPNGLLPDAQKRIHKLPVYSDIEGNDFSEKHVDSSLDFEDPVKRVDKIPIEDIGFDEDEDFMNAPDERMEKVPSDSDVKINNLSDDDDELTRQSRLRGSLCGCGSMERCVTVFNCLTAGCNFTYECLGATDPDPCAKDACRRDQACYRVRAENKGENSTCPDIIGKCIQVTAMTEKPGKCPKVDFRASKYWFYCWKLWFIDRKYDKYRIQKRKRCQNEQQCCGDQKCCQLKSGKKCMSPVTDGDQPGQCPTTTNRYECACRFQCANDSECPFGLKCCDCSGKKKCVRPIAPATTGI